MEWLSNRRVVMRNSAVAVMITCVTVLSIFGVVMLYSTSSATFGEQILIKQSIWISLGLVSAIIIYFIDYRLLCKHAKKLLFISVIPLIILAAVHVLAKVTSPEVADSLPLVKGINGSYRWFTIGSFSIQPGEFVKIFIIIFVASYYGLNPRRVQRFKKGILIPGLIVGTVLFLVLMGGSLSITAITAMVVVAMLFIAGIKFRYHAIIFLVGCVVVTSVLLLSPARMKRVTKSWFTPEKDKQGAGYQLYHAQLALGHGGAFGVGLNKGRMKQQYLPESHTDFIMANVGEELGFVTIVVVLLSYLLLIGSAMWISSLAPDRIGTLLGFGVGFSIGIHAFMNLCVVSGALPTTGVTAPFVSYGGSSMLVTWIGIGLLASIVRVSNQEDKVVEEHFPAPEASQELVYSG